MRVSIVVLLLFNMSILSGGFLTSESTTNPSFPTVGPSVYVDPPKILDKSMGDTLSISVKIFNLTDTVVPDPAMPAFRVISLGNLYGLEVEFHWDPKILKYISHTVTIPVEDHPGGILHKPVMSIIDEVNATAGAYKVAYASMEPAPPFNNPGKSNTIFSMSFQVIGEGATHLRLPIESIRLAGKKPGTHIGRDKDGNPTYLHSFDGFFSVIGAPVAKFTSWPPDAAVVNKPVVFNASASYDPDGGTIILYLWDFGDGTRKNTTDPIISHTFTAAGRTYEIALRVLDDEKVLSPATTKRLDVVSRRDVALTSVTISPLRILLNLKVRIDVYIKNEGEVTENFTVQAYYNKTAIDTATQWAKIMRGDVVDLKPGFARLLTLYWNTSNVTPEAQYSIMVNASAVPHEEDINDNVWRSDKLPEPIFVSVVSKLIHDIAIARVDVVAWARHEHSEEFPPPVILGENATVRVDVMAVGTVDEIFSASIHLIAPNGTVLRTEQWLNKSLGVGKRESLWLSFDTKRGFDVGDYMVRVRVTITEEDADLTNNFVEKKFSIIKPPSVVIAPLPKLIHIGDAIAFDATASHHPSGDIVKYKWTFYEGAVARWTREGPSVHSTFDRAGMWKVVLEVTDNHGMTYHEYRPASKSYQMIQTIIVEEKPIEAPYTLYAAILMVVVVIIGALAYLRFRKCKST